MYARRYADEQYIGVDGRGVGEDLVEGHVVEAKERRVARRLLASNWQSRSVKDPPFYLLYFISFILYSIFYIFF